MGRPFFLYFGFCLMLLMRWQLAFPGQALTWANAMASHRCTNSTRSAIISGSTAIRADRPDSDSRPIPTIRRLLERIFGKDQMPGGS